MESSNEGKVITISALVEVNKKGLPEDFSKVRAKEALLRPFPVEMLTNFTKESFERKGYGPEDGVEFEDFFEVLGDLYEFSNERLKFADWGYSIFSFFNMYDYDVIIEVRAKKLNTKLSFSLDKTFISEDSFAARDDVETETDEYDIEYPKAKEYVKFLYKFFEEVRKNIVQWNKVCANSLPIVNTKPPYEEFKEMCMTAFWECVVEAEWSHYGIDEMYDDFEDFLDGHPFWLGFVIYYTLYEMSIGFGDKPKFLLEFETWEEGTGEFMILTGYIKIKGVNIRYIVFEEEFHLHFEELYVDEAERFFGHILDEINDSIVQWNKIITKGG